MKKLVLMFSLFAMACSGGVEIGGVCEMPGTSDECVSGALCTNESGGNTCQQICENQEECEEGFSCNGVTGSSEKTCQPDGA